MAALGQVGKKVRWVNYVLGPGGSGGSMVSGAGESGGSG